MTEEKVADLVIVDYKDLCLEPSLTIRSKIAAAFGKTGIGVIGISGVPDYVQAKSSILQQANPLANLPPNELKDLEDPDSLYNAGMFS
jgi:hypothetical protein